MTQIAYPRMPGMDKTLTYEDLYVTAKAMARLLQAHYGCPVEHRVESLHSGGLVRFAFNVNGDWLRVMWTRQTAGTKVDLDRAVAALMVRTVERLTRQPIRVQQTMKG